MIDGKRRSRQKELKKKKVVCRYTLSLKDLNRECLEFVSFWTGIEQRMQIKLNVFSTKVGISSTVNKKRYSFLFLD